MEDQEEDQEQEEEMFNQVDQVIHHHQVLLKVILVELTYFQDHFQQVVEVELLLLVQMHKFLHQVEDQEEQVQQIQFQDHQ
jgi:hypothetical protein